MSNSRKNIDIRIMKLNRWYVPKSTDLHECENPVILGYFDELQVRKADADNTLGTVHPFTAGYAELVRWRSQNKILTVDYSAQEQILFLNMAEDEEENGTSFHEKTVEDFWNRENGSCPYLFLSMIHISHSGKLVKALQKIKKVFRDNYLSYISYDYCDIVLFARKMQIPDFVNKIQQLFEVSEGEEKVIFDTFSMVSFYPACNQAQVDGQKTDASESDKAAKEQFQVTINLSIRDHRAFEEWYQREADDQGFKTEYYDLFGRHDVSITREDADTQWLMRIMEKLHDKENQKIFWTFETFIKVKRTSALNIDSDTAEGLEEVYKKVKDRMQREIDKLRDAIKRLGIIDEVRYILPVYEVRDCIWSIAKNNFAEEFICCIYESFLHFISYITVEIEKLNTTSKDPRLYENEIAKTYDKYFAAINTLVNSTMHNERQFVQATAFNAVFCSVPPKIMAFYNAYIYRIKQILRETDSREYTFLIYPSFTPIMSIEPITPDTPPPSDRILTVRISERFLYDIESVIYQLVHELAHYVGHNLRCRSTRRKKIMPALLRWIAEECGVEREIYQILLQVDAEDRTDAQVENCVDYTLYLEYLPEVSKNLIRILGNWKNIQDLFERYYQEHNHIMEEDQFLTGCGIGGEYQQAYIENYIKQYAFVKHYSFHEKLMKMNSFDRADKYRAYIELIQDVYHECYADLQMILVLGMDVEDYLSTFLINLEVPVESLLSRPESIIRISAVFRTMMECRIWQMPQEQDHSSFRRVFDFIGKYNQSVTRYVEEDRIAMAKQKAENLAVQASRFDARDGIRLKNKDEEKIQLFTGEQMPEITPFAELAEGVYEYLLEVLGVSLEEYSLPEKAQKIKQLRILIKKILCFEDATEVFNCVEKELITYKREGCQI